MRLRQLSPVIFGLLTLANGCHLAGGQTPIQTLFGTTEPLKGAFHGRVYKLPFGTEGLPDFEMLHAISDLYTYSLDIKPQNYAKYSPAIPQSEWFGIEYKASFWITQPGEYRFFVLSDDGARLYIDNLPIIDNDGQHQPRIKAAPTKMLAGLHRMRVSYFQGPPTGVALELAVQPPGGHVRIFDLRDFPVPGDSASPNLEDRTGKTRQ
jgi:hypothetical protein